MRCVTPTARHFTGTSTSTSISIQQPCLSFRLQYTPTLKLNFSFTPLLSIPWRHTCSQPTVPTCTTYLVSYHTRPASTELKTDSRQVPSSQAYADNVRECARLDAALISLAMEIMSATSETRHRIRQGRWDMSLEREWIRGRNGGL